MKTQMNTDPKWLLRMAEEEGNCELSVGGLAHEVGLLRPAVEAIATSRAAFAKLIEFRRRDSGWSIEDLAKRADVDLQELICIEQSADEVPDPRTVHQLAGTLKLPEQRLLQLAGLAQARDARVTNAAVRFAARSKSIDQLTREEHDALEEFVKILAEK